MTSLLAAATDPHSRISLHGKNSAQLDELRAAIDRAGELLPAQGPITAFVFLNTLQAFEDLPFDEGVQTGGRLFGCHPYLPEERYREKFARGRITPDDLTAVLRDDLGETAETTIAGLTTRLRLRQMMLQYPLRTGPTAELRWFVAETDSLTRVRAETPLEIKTLLAEETKRWVMRDYFGQRGGTHPAPAGNAPLAFNSPINELVADLLEKYDLAKIESWDDATWETVALQTLWRICRLGVECASPSVPSPAPQVRHRDLLLALTGQDSDELVHEALIRFCAAFSDQGFAIWELPEREAGFYQAFHAVYSGPAGPLDRWLRPLPDELQRIAAAGFSPLESIAESLELLGIPQAEHAEYLTHTMLALRGWASTLRQMEVRGDRVPLPAPAGTLVEFIAVRLLLERLAVQYLARQDLAYHGSLEDLRDELRKNASPAEPPSADQRAFLIFQLAQVLGWYPHIIFQLHYFEWSELLREIDAFDGLERRRILHSAFERNYRGTALDAFSIHMQRPVRRVPHPRFQLVCCIDTREESFRRHLEEAAPQSETFGAAGFYGVAMYYRGVADAHFATLCPIVIRPQHWVVEKVVLSLLDQHERRAKTRKALGTASHSLHLGSRSIAGGALLTAGVGILASIPLVARVLFPGLTSRIRKHAGRFVEPPPVTRLKLERTADPPGPDDDHIGFSVTEMADRGERMLRDIGLTSNLARLVVFLGHGSFCLNNPHKSAYDCGACSGGAGGPNARALAAMLNDPRVREILTQRGLKIPRDTCFLGGLHNTCNDTVSFLDLDLLPLTHQHDFEYLRETLEEACQRNAHERCRRFDSAPLDLTLTGARQHVAVRSEDLAQTRPEFGNATNAVCFVGRRERARGMYLDRRCFQHSYDPTLDDAEYSILARILAAVVPVCQGINLQYFFSYIDSPGWGSGTKLPHNITSLMGVMDGAESDLRLGLPWQGVEIHEPMRLLFIIESTPAGMRLIMERNTAIGKILGNGWAQLAVLDPHSAELKLFQKGEFLPYVPERRALPQVGSSQDWYRGWRAHLGFAQIGLDATNAGAQGGLTPS